MALSLAVGAFPSIDPGFLVLNPSVQDADSREEGGVDCRHSQLGLSLDKRIGFRDDCLWLPSELIDILVLRMKQFEYFQGAMLSRSISKKVGVGHLSLLLW